MSFLAGSLTEQPSFHASLFEEEWKKRTSVIFDVDVDDDPQVVQIFFFSKILI